MNLFDEGARHDGGARRPAEDTFSFINRVDDVWFGRVRDALEGWFEAVPADEQRGLRARLRSNSPENSDPAFWELYLRELLRRTGFAVAHEPKREHRRRPDFLATGEGMSFYLEARFVGATEQRRALDRLTEQITAQVRQVETDDFLLYFDIERYGSTLPRMRPVRTKVEAWLAGLTYDGVMSDAKAKRALPEATFGSGEWRFWFRAIPRGPSRRGIQPRTGALGMGPITRSGGSAAARFTAVLKQKAGRYGDLGQPFVLALCCGDDFVDFEDIVSALFGEPAPNIREDGSAFPFRTRTGLFSGRGHPRVSAVITIRAMRPWLVNNAVPVIWKNPKAQFVFEEHLAWAAHGHLEHDGTTVVEEPTQSVGEVLGLPDDWPGPERPLRARTPRTP